MGILIDLSNRPERDLQCSIASGTCGRFLRRGLSSLFRGQLFAKSGQPEIGWVSLGELLQGKFGFLEQRLRQVEANLLGNLLGLLGLAGGRRDTRRFLEPS